MGIIKIILDAISPQLRNLIVEFVRNLSAHADKTPNPWDNVLVDILKILLDIKE